MSHSNCKKLSQFYFVKMLTINIGKSDFYKRELNRFKKRNKYLRKKLKYLQEK